MIEAPSTLSVSTPTEMHDLGVRLGRDLGAGDVLVLTGPLGAGKTTLTRGIGEGLGVRGPVTSPTFVLARTHPSLVGGTPLVHVDAYRLDDPLQLDDLDIDVDGSVVIVEWGRGMVEALTDSWVEVEIVRPLGAAAGPPGGDPDHDAAADGGGADGEGDSGDVGDADDAEDADEPRTVTITRGGTARSAE